MRMTWTGWVGCLLVTLALSGCGEGKPEINSTPDADKPNQPPAGEVVVEPSSVKLVGDEGDALALLRELLVGDTAGWPEGFSAKIDDTFEHQRRLRFAVEPDGEAKDDAIKQAATEVYSALESAFHERSEQALRDAAAGALGDVEEAKQHVSELQQTINTFLKSQQGLPATTETSKKKRVYRIMMDSALETQIEHEKRLEKLKRRLDRGDYVKLVRIR